MTDALRRRPIVWALAFFAGGVLAALFSRSLAAFALVFLAFGGAAGLMAYFAGRRYIMAYLLFFALGALLAARSAAPRDPAAEALADSGQTLTMSGVVLDVFETGGGRQAIRFKCLEADGRKTAFVIAATFPDGESAVIGQAVTLSGKLARLEHAAAPGGFDAYWYYKSRKTDYQAYPTVLSKGEVRRSPALALYSFRERLCAVYDAIFPPEEAGLVKSIVLGDRSGLDAYTQELYRAAGIYHILSVSGLHVTIISAVIFFLLKRLTGSRLRGVLTLAFAAAYTVMTGAGMPAVRSLVMSAVVIVGRLLYRERDFTSSIAFACLCLLIYEPLYLLDAGFQLSFSAVYGISALAAPLVRAFGKGGLGRAKGLAGSSAAATLGMLPVMSWHFYTFQTYSILVNMIILPTTSLLMVAATAAGFAGLFSLTAASFAGGAAYYLLRFYDYVCSFFTALPFSALLTGRPGVPLYILAYACVLALALWLSKPIPGKTGRRAFLCLFAAAAALFAYGRYGGGLRVTEPASPRDGCAVAVRGREAVLFGAGLTQNAPAAYLDYLGIDSVAAVFLSRADGADAAMANVLAGEKKIRRLFAPPGGAGYPSGAEVTEIRDGDAVTLGGITVDVMGPDGDGAYAFRASADGVSVLFAEGLDWAPEDVIKYGNELAADALFLPGKAGIWEALTDAAAPEIAVAGAAAPGGSRVSAEAALYMASRGIPLYDAASRGAVTISAGGIGPPRRMVVTTMLPP
ncbi:MAG: competence protein ComEC family protein [Firmicutes bacterium]|nr:competence protein ComEC family protein [Bacillota bacterium]